MDTCFSSYCLLLDNQIDKFILLDSRQKMKICGDSLVMLVGSLQFEFCMTSSLENQGSFFLSLSLPSLSVCVHTHGCAPFVIFVLFFWDCTWDKINEKLAAWVTIYQSGAHAGISISWSFLTSTRLCIIQFNVLYELFCFAVSSSRYNFPREEYSA